MDVASLALNIVAIIQVLQQTYETLKDAPDALGQLLSQSNSLAALLRRLDSIDMLLSDDRRRFLASQFDRTACASTIGELRTLVEKIKPHDDAPNKSAFALQQHVGLSMKQRIIWLLKESDVKKLSERMKTHCTSIANATDQILLECGLFMEKQLLELREAMSEKSKTIVATSRPTVADARHLPLFLSQYRLMSGQTFTIPYFLARDNLSTAAYYGDWNECADSLETGLAIGKDVYNQSWINATRIKESDDWDPPSRYTPLHQAAWHGATTSIVEKLILAGAWRLARTVKNGKMQTPLEVAEEFGWTHLYPLLWPVIYHSIPPVVLLGLQTQLNLLFAEAFPGTDQYFAVPQVEILTELENGQLMVKLDGDEDSGKSRGMQLFLDGREIVAVVDKSDGSTAVYRICEHSWGEIDRGILLALR